MRNRARLTAMADVTAAARAEARPTDCGAQQPAISMVLADYRGAIERLDARGTEQLFVTESAIIENGGVEGNYANYLAHHLGPELPQGASLTRSASSRASATS
jgi:hypothetical protein